MHREIGYGTKFTNADSLQEKDGALERGKSLEIFDDITSTKSPEALQQQERQHEEQMAQQQWEAEQRLCVEALRLAAQTSTQLNAEFRVMEHDSSAKMEKESECRSSGIKS